MIISELCLYHCCRYDFNALLQQQKLNESYEQSAAYLRYTQEATEVIKNAVGVCCSFLYEISPVVQCDWKCVAWDLLIEYNFNRNIFLPCDAMLSALYAVIVCLCVCVCVSVCLFVCLSVCLSHSGIVSKWLNVGSRK